MKRSITPTNHNSNITGFRDRESLFGIHQNDGVPESWDAKLAYWTRATPRRTPRDSRQICRGHQLSLHNSRGKCIRRKCLTLKMKVNEMKHNVRNGAIWWQLSKFIKYNTFMLFETIVCYVSPLPRYQHFILFNLTVWVRVVEYNIRNDAIRWRISTAIEIIACYEH